MRKVNVIINKNWEAEPALAALFGYKFRPDRFPFPEVLIGNQDGKTYVGKPREEKYVRAVLRFRKDNKPDNPIDLEVKFWCINDFMPDIKNTSSSADKFRFLPELLALEKVDLNIAVGTAGFVSETSYAGSVVVGSRFFIHDAHPGTPENPYNDFSNMKDEYFNSFKTQFETLLPQNVNPVIFGKIFDEQFKNKVDPKLLKTPVNPTIRATCLASQYYTAIGIVNVTDYGEYAWSDTEAIRAFRKIEARLPIGSVETTHGIIRLCSETPTIFVSAITDREGHFDMEVTPGQNYVASFNSGIVLGQLLSNLNDLLLKDIDMSKSGFNFGIRSQNNT